MLRAHPCRRVARRLGLASAAAAVVVVGASAPTSAAGHPARAPSYRWLIPTEGAPLSIAVENRNQGTEAWRLHSAQRRDGDALDGYVSSQSVSPAQPLTFYVRAGRARWV